MTAFWVGFIVGGSWIAVVLGTARLCGMNQIDEDE